MDSNLKNTQTKTALFYGASLAGLTITFLALLPRDYSLDILTVLLVLIASVYLGFAIMDGRPLEIATEVIAALLFIAIALLGLWVSPYFWLVGYLGHGLWDVVHSKHAVQTNVPSWYKPFCMVYDWMIAVFLLFWL